MSNYIKSHYKNKTYMILLTYKNGGLYEKEIAHLVSELFDKEYEI
jgi:hypothetical protein